MCVWSHHNLANEWSITINHLVFFNQIFFSILYFCSPLISIGEGDLETFLEMVDDEQFNINI